MILITGLNGEMGSALVQRLKELDVKNILLETTFISQSTTISTQLNQFQQKDNNLSLSVKFNITKTIANDAKPPKYPKAQPKLEIKPIL